MIAITTALAFLNKSKYFLITGVFVALLLSVYTLAISNEKLTIENNRKDANLENITKQKDAELTLKDSEYEYLDTQWKTKLDSVKKANNIYQKSLREAWMIEISSRDTSDTPVVHQTAIETTTPSNTPNPIKISPKYYKIPVAQDVKCWGMKGYILSHDPKSTLVITDRTTSNSIQRLDISNRLWGFLWYTKKSTVKAYTDCGEAKIMKVTFKK